MATLEQIMTETPIMPHSEDAERLVIGTLLTDWNRHYEETDLLQPEHFYIDRNKDIFQAMQNISRRGEQVDVVTVTAECFKMQMKVTPADIALYTMNGFSSSIIEHIAIIRDDYKRRKFVEIGALLQSNGFSRANDINDVLSDVKEKLDGIFVTNQDNVFTLKDAVDGVYRNISRNMAGSTELTGDPTGFTLLDKRSGGLQTSDLIIIAAETSQGKTSFAIKLAMSCGCPVVFYSMEMKKEQIAARMVSIASGVPANEILFSKLDTGQIQNVDKGVGRIVNLPVYFDDRSTSNIDSILSSIRMMKIKYGIKGVFVDYLQILNVNMKGSNKEQQMGDVARRLKNIAKELDIWVVALSQLNRDAQNPVPTLARLRDSGQIAEAADMVILIYRPEVYGKRYPNPFTGKETKDTAMIDIAKGRNIGLMKFIVGFRPDTTDFHELDKIPDYQSKPSESRADDLPF